MPTPDGKPMTHRHYSRGRCGGNDPVYVSLILPVLWNYEIKKISVFSPQYACAMPVVHIARTFQRGNHARIRTTPHMIAGRAARIHNRLNARLSQRSAAYNLRRRTPTDIAQADEENPVRRRWRNEVIHTRIEEEESSSSLSTHKYSTLQEKCSLFLRQIKHGNTEQSAPNLLTSSFVNKKIANNKHLFNTYPLLRVKRI